MQHEIRKWATSTDSYLSLFLTMSDQRKNFMMGMNMPDEVYDNEIPLFIRQTRADNFVTNLREADDKVFGYSRFDGEQLQSSQRRGRYANIYPFGMNDMAFSTDDTSINRAKLINFLYSTADYNDNGVMVDIGPGDVTYCAPGEGHGIACAGDEPVEMIALILYE